MFNKNIVVKILNTPLFEQVQQERMVWKAEKHGHYSVRSAYRLCVMILLTYLTSVGRVFGPEFGDLKFLPRLRIWFGECVGVVYQHGSVFKIKAFNVL
jgi:hypothetical protein